MAGFALRTSFARHASVSPKAAHEPRFASDRPTGADQAFGQSSIPGEQIGGVIEHLRDALAVRDHGLECVSARERIAYGQHAYPYLANDFFKVLCRLPL